MYCKRGIILPIVIASITLISFSVLGLLMFQKNIQNKKVETQFSPTPNTEIITQTPETSPSPQEPKTETLQSIQTNIWKPICQSSNIKNIESKVDKGDSQTTISRKAIEQYFNQVALSQESSTLLRLDGEESVYAEDYIRKTFPFPTLTINSNITIPCPIIENATLKARELTIIQKVNLEKYKKNETELELYDIIKKNMEQLCIDSPDLCKYSGELSL